MKDKARMQHRLSVPNFDEDATDFMKEERGRDNRSKIFKQ